MTNVCNWDCKYCITDTPKSKKNKQNIFINELLDKISIVGAGDMVSLNGGEPGLVKKKIMDEFINTLVSKNCEIRVNTNGEFIKRYPQYLKYIDEINYHCSENLDDEIEHKNIEYSGILNHILVVTDENHVRLGGYLEKNSDIKFRIYGAARPYSELPGREYISKKNVLKIISEFKDKIDLLELKKIFHNNCTNEITNL